MKKPEAIDQWPVGRGFHSGVIINIRSDSPLLVISGGKDRNQDVLDDCWIFNVAKQYWIKVRYIIINDAHTPVCAYVCVHIYVHMCVQCFGELITSD